MSDAPQAFCPQHYGLGVARDGRPVDLAPVTATGAEALGMAISAIGPWAHYGISADSMARLLSSEGAACYQLECAGALAGAVVVRPSWLIGPYLQTLAILPRYQNQGIGAMVLAWYEAEAIRGRSRSAWLCVSAFNPGAQRFYLAHGYERVATFEDLVRDGDDELLMRKRLV